MESFARVPYATRFHGRCLATDIGIAARKLRGTVAAFVVCSSVSAGIGEGWAQDIPELDLSIPEGRMSSGIPAIELMEIRVGEKRTQGGGWILVFRNLERPAQTPRTELYRRLVRAPGSAGDEVIVWEVSHSDNTGCDAGSGVCADRIRIIGVPEGYMALPGEALVDEREGIRIHIVPEVFG